MKRVALVFVFLLTLWPAQAQVNHTTAYNEVDAAGNISRRSANKKDSLGSDKVIPKGLSVWTVDRFGDRQSAVPDTLSPMFMNTIFTTGLRGEYNTTGNLGAPRINRIFADRPTVQTFLFTAPYDFVITPVTDFHFTNTLSPITNLSFNSCGDKTNGEDHLKALFAANVGKRLGLGMKFDYVYGRGYYDSQHTSHFDYTVFGSYLGDRYQAHLLMSLNHQKVTENGGITDDNYITHPEIYDDDYDDSEIPTVLTENWNRNDNQHIFLTHRYNVGFHRKVPMTEDEIKARKFALESKKENDEAKEKERLARKARRDGQTFDEEAFDNRKTYSGRPDDARIAGDEPADTLVRERSGRISVDGKAAGDSLAAQIKKVSEDSMWMKTEYVPVTSFIHTVSFDHYRRIYQAYATPDDYYADEYYDTGKLTGDSIYDKTRHFQLKNTFAVSLLEGFNKWAKAGLKVFASHTLRHYELPDEAAGVSKWNEQGIFVGGQISKTQGSLLHYNATGEFGVAGDYAGEVRVDATADLNFRLFGDTLQLAATAFFHREEPDFYFRHYQARHFWWDNDLDMTTHTRIQGVVTYPKTRTKLRVAVDELTDYTYFSQSYGIDDNGYRTGVTVTPVQSGDAVNVITASLSQDFAFGIFHWENVLTWQHSNKQDVLPLPDFNLYSNLFLRFRIAKVLNCDFGADVRYFTKYYAPDYSPALGSYTVQGNTDNRVETGNYPIVNVYANFHLKHTRFFVMYSHANQRLSNGNYFLTPHYPLNGSKIRFGLSWNFFN